VTEQGFQAPSVFRFTLIIAGQKVFFQADGTGFLGQIFIYREKGRLQRTFFPKKHQPMAFKRTVLACA
jgi:hypothetical protein